jgi:hypothetical protein
MIETLWPLNQQSEINNQQSSSLALLLPRSFSGEADLGCIEFFLRGRE